MKTTMKSCCSALMTLAGLLIAGLYSGDAAAWGDHYMVTAGALKGPKAAALGDLDAAVTVESLDEFLAAEPAAVAATFDAYYDWQTARGSTQFHRMSFDKDQPNTAAFLNAARLNPKTIFPLVTRLLPDQKPAEGAAVVAPNQVSPKLNWREPLPMVFVDISGQTTSARAELTSFADEPDWGMDHELWDIAAYGYGEQPWGKPEGESSKAPFHMQFNHENFFIKNFASDFLKGMMLDRVQMFVQLARTAFDTGHDYWGWRFTAWAEHYVQDLSQPYHAKAAPSAGNAYYIRYLISPAKKKMVKKATQLLSNRHFIFEDYVSFGMLQSYTTDDQRFKRLVGYLAAPPDAVVLPVPADSAALIDEVSTRSAALGKVIDQTIKSSYPKEYVADWHFDVETSPGYSVEKSVSEVDPGADAKLLDQTSLPFGLAGEATRAIVGLCHPTN